MKNKVTPAYDLYVPATLTIDPETIVKFHPIDDPYLVLNTGGKIKMTPTVVIRNGKAAQQQLLPPVG